MSRTADEIIDEARTLPEAERARVAEELLRSIETPDQAEIDQAWGREADRRLERYTAGLTKAIPVEQAIEEVQRALRAKRP